MSQITTNPTADRPKGETFVWLCSAGLALGVLMVVFLIGLIFWEGITVFWPKQVAEVTLRDDSAFKMGQENTIAGVVVKKQHSQKRKVDEWQHFLGNKDANGGQFKNK